MDPTSINVFGSIYDADFHETEDLFMKVRSEIAHDVGSFPRCRICFGKIKVAGFPKTGTYIINPSDGELAAFFQRIPYLKQLVVEMSSICNLKCRGCMQSRLDIPGTRKAPLIDYGELTRWISGGLHQIEKIRLYNYGETFVHRKALDFCSFVKENNPSTELEIATNGLLLDTDEKRALLVKNGIDRVVLSIHGGSQVGVSQYMTDKFDFKAILYILENLVHSKKALGVQTPFIEWKYLLFDWNDSDIEMKSAVEYDRAIGIDAIRFVLPGYPSPSKRFPGFGPNKTIKNIVF